MKVEHETRNSATNEGTSNSKQQHWNLAGDGGATEKRERRLRSGCWVLEKEKLMGRCSCRWSLLARFEIFCSGRRSSIFRGRSFGVLVRCRSAGARFSGELLEEEDEESSSWSFCA
ncbi:hypothetical protein A4A49_26900 [Nicotiana attenuata]|uniref:Uncharacterized protein n=1 Tax=Nicotiana attenuata TaxID=49451 RepID=A0A1J6J0E8_NICAT|nr:hypothetical protein A4A49_26900 [Nicotiana attenuata]